MNEKNNSQNLLFDEAINYHLKGNYSSALKVYKQILKKNPNLVAVYNNIGLIQKELGQSKKALKSFLNALNINSNFVEAHNNVAIIYEEMEEYEKGIYHCKQAITINPDFAKAYNNLGSLYDEIGETNLAIKNFKKSIELDPQLIESYNNLGSIFRYSGNYIDAKKYYQKGISQNKNYFKIRKNLGLLYLLLSDYEKGFEEFEWRIKEKSKKEYINPNINSSLWKGENLNMKTILVLSEQGIGDIIQFVRYIYELQDKYKAKIIFRTHKKLVNLFINNKFQIISTEQKIPKHDYHIFLMSLPKFHYQREKVLLKNNCFIKKDEKIFLKWKKKLSKFDSPKIGINWQGNQFHGADKYRSIPLNFFETLFELNGINYINLLKNYGEEQIKNFKYKDRLINFSANVDNNENSFEDTKEIIRNLDLVITSCTAIAHLSSTMNIKTWILISYSPDWRWFLDKKTTYWYDTAKLFRQKKDGDWINVFKDVKKELLKEFFNI